MENKKYCPKCEEKLTSFQQSTFDVLNPQDQIGLRYTCSKCGTEFSIEYTFKGVAIIEKKFVDNTK